MKTRENDPKNSKEKEKFPTAGVPDRKVTALSIDCLQSAFSLKIHLVLISASAIANHDVFSCSNFAKENKRLLAVYVIYCATTAGTAEGEGLVGL